MADAYTPTTSEVRQGFVAPRYIVDPQRADEDFAAYLSRASIEGHQMQMLSEAMFDRWLAEHDRQEVEPFRAAIDRALAHRLDHGAQGNGYAQLVERIRAELRPLVRTSADVPRGRTYMAPEEIDAEFGPGAS